MTTQTENNTKKQVEWLKYINTFILSIIAIFTVISFNMISTIIKDNAANYNGSISSISNSYNFYIGNRYTGSNLSAGGYMDEFAIWNRALREDEAKALYSQGNGKFY